MVEHPDRPREGLGLLGVGAAVFATAAVVAASVSPLAGTLSERLRGDGLHAVQSRAAHAVGEPVISVLRAAPPSVADGAGAVARLSATAALEWPAPPTGGLASAPAGTGIPSDVVVLGPLPAPALPMPVTSDEGASAGVELVAPAPALSTDRGRSAAIGAEGVSTASAGGGKAAKTRKAHPPLRAASWGPPASAGETGEGNGRDRDAGPAKAHDRSDRAHPHGKAHPRA